MVFLSTGRFLICSLLLAASCSCSGTQSPFEPQTPPTAFLTRSIGDPPFSTTLTLIPPTDVPEPWTFSIEADIPDFTRVEGELLVTVRHPLVVPVPGVYRLMLTYESTWGSVVDTLFVVGNPDIVSSVHTVSVEQDEVTEVTGLKVVADQLLLSANVFLQARSLETLELTHLLELGDNSRGSLQALSQSSSGLLYVIDRLVGSIAEIDPHTFEVLRLLVAADYSNHLVDARVPNILYAGGSNGVAILSLSSGEVIAERRFVDGRFFSVAPSRDLIAFAIGLGPHPRIVLLDGTSLATVWSHDTPSFKPDLIAVSSDETAVYALGKDENDDLHFIALSVPQGTILRSLVLEPCAGCRHGILGSTPVAHTTNITFLASIRGTYVIDETLDLPIARVTRIDRQACCSIAFRSEPPTLYSIDPSREWLSAFTLTLPQP